LSFTSATSSAQDAGKQSTPIGDQYTFVATDPDITVVPNGLTAGE
jgi:hypothetical protein